VVRDSIQRITESPFIPRKDEVRGFIYDVKTGRFDEISWHLGSIRRAGT